VHRLWQVDVESGAATPLTDAAITPFKIANGDWSVSPDGRHVAFVSASDNNIWLLTLPEN
jgi:Tol biopolymer transport system component